MTESSYALYRKYRPQDFSQVRNQGHIIKVLEGAIAKNAIPHALLFTGSRGTGKTTVARIFAHAIGAKDIDIYEIDAASNRGIDDIRELKNAVYTLPYESPRKVYIIDEVHMLTKEAFNALLKTLEEPPAHVVFILATTERDRLLDTITSRCQIFEFKTPTREELRDTVLSVARTEQFTLDENGADIIAISADGSYRDALGIMQKVMMASGDTVLDADEIATIVGAPKNVLLRDILQALHERQSAPALHALSRATDAHVDMKLFVRLLLERVRAVMLIRHGSDADAELINFGKDEQELIRSYAQDIKSPLNSRMLLRLLEASEQTGKTSIPELPLELAIVEICDEKRP